MKSRDISGLKFNYLTVLNLHHKVKRFNKDGTSKGYIEYWLCQCDCGNKTVVEKQKIISGHTSSCGCFCKAQIRKTHSKHNLSNTRIFRIWGDIKTRCTNPNSRAYKYYGQNNIVMCDEWKNDFQVFNDWAMSNGYADELTIDRIDVNGNYEPSNCRWVGMKVQNRNKHNSRMITYKNETHNLSEWAEILGINYKALFKRLSDGWSVEKAFSTPILKSLK